MRLLKPKIRENHTQNYFQRKSIASVQQHAKFEQDPTCQYTIKTQISPLLQRKVDLEDIQGPMQAKNEKPQSKIYLRRGSLQSDRSSMPSVGWDSTCSTRCVTQNVRCLQIFVGLEDLHKHNPKMGSFRVKSLSRGSIYSLWCSIQTQVAIRFVVGLLLYDV